MLSTWDSARMLIKNRTERDGTVCELIKPQVIENYTKNMGGVDRADHYISSFCFLRKTLKWWKKLFFWGLQTAVINSYILHKENCSKNNMNPMSHRKFQRAILNKLVNDFRQGSTKRGRTSTIDKEQRLNGKLHVIRVLPNKKTKDCLVCSNSNKRRRTTYYCDTCDRKPGLHIGDCFLRYHTKEEYKQ